MTLDLSNPDHEAALVDACAISRSATSIKVIAANPSILDTRPLVAKALANLSSPASAAELIRQLVERGGAGVDVKVVRGIQWRIVYYAGNEREWFAVNDADGKVLATIPTLITHLLALAPSAGVEAVLQALRGEA